MKLYGLYDACGEASIAPECHVLLATTTLQDEMILYKHVRLYSRNSGHLLPARYLPMGTLVVPVWDYLIGF